MSRDVLIFESIKLTAQIIGALFAARLAVNWALHRYKREQVWTRRLSAYTDILATLGSMRKQFGDWQERELKATAWPLAASEEVSREDEHKLYRLSMSQLQSSVPVASLVFPRDAVTLLENLVIELNRETDEHDAFSHYGRRYDQVDTAIIGLVKLGRHDLGEGLLSK